MCLAHNRSCSTNFYIVNVIIYKLLLRFGRCWFNLFNRVLTFTTFPNFFDRMTDTDTCPTPPHAITSITTREAAGEPWSHKHPDSSVHCSLLTLPPSTTWSWRLPGMAKWIHTSHATRSHNLLPWTAQDNIVRQFILLIMFQSAWKWFNISKPSNSIPVCIMEYQSTHMRTLQLMLLHPSSPLSCIY